MILKELDPYTTDDLLLRAGRAAEVQMAYHLQRAFADDDQFVVINGLRIEHAGDAAQIDHLILHRHGATIVESKNVAGKIRINEHDEWARLYNKGSRGMASPPHSAPAGPVPMARTVPPRPSSPSASASRVEAAARVAPAPAPTCRQCGSERLRVAYGYSYFYTCEQCQGSTPIAHTCSACGARERTRKVGAAFYRVCSGCKTSVLFHTDAARP